jgi:hypothetical protein
VDSTRCPQNQIIRVRATLESVTSTVEATVRRLGGGEEARWRWLRASKHDDGCEDAIVAARKLYGSAAASERARAHHASATAPRQRARRATLSWPRVRLAGARRQRGGLSRARRGSSARGVVVDESVLEKSTWRRSRAGARDADKAAPVLVDGLVGRRNRGGKVEHGFQGRGRACQRQGRQCPQAA